MFVEVLVGKDKGRQGTVVKVVRERNWCFVQGLHFDTKVKKDDLRQNQKYVERQEKPLLVTSEVKLVDPNDEKGTDIEWRFNESGDRVRVSKRTGRIITIPMEHLDRLEDYTQVSKYKRNAFKDTTAKVIEDVTFTPQLCTFEQDILKLHGIEETRKRKKTYWY